MSQVNSKCVTLLGDPPPEARDFYDSVHAYANTARTSSSSKPTSRPKSHSRKHRSLNTKCCLLPQRRGTWKPSRNTTVNASKLHKNSHHVNELTEHAILSFIRSSFAWENTQLAALQEWKQLRLEEHLPGNIFERLDREEAYTSEPDADMNTIISIFNRLFFFNALDIEFRWKRNLSRKGKAGFGTETRLDHGRFSLIRIHSTLIQDEVVCGSGRYLRAHCRLGTLLHEMAHAYLGQYSDQNCRQCSDLVGRGGHGGPWQLLTWRLEEASILLLDMPLFLGRFHSFLDAGYAAETPIPSVAEVEKWRLLWYWPALRTRAPASRTSEETMTTTTPTEEKRVNAKGRKLAILNAWRRQKKATHAIKDQPQTPTIVEGELSERIQSPSSLPSHKDVTNLGVAGTEENGNPKTSSEDLSSQTSGEKRTVPPPKALKKESMPRLHYSVLKSLGMLKAKRHSTPGMKAPGLVPSNMR